MDGPPLACRRCSGSLDVNRLAGYPVRMRGEEAVCDGDLEGNEEPEGEAEQAGCNTEAAIEWGEAPARVGKWGANHHGDEHHAGDGSNAEDQKIPDGPAWIANFRQNQQSDRG